VRREGLLSASDETGPAHVSSRRDRDEDVRSERCAVLRYLFKLSRLLSWGPEQVAEFDALARRKLGEGYGALRGIAGVWEDAAGSSEGTLEAPLWEIDAPG
jgi:hypothetical protein